MSEIISPDLAINGSIPIKSSEVSSQLDLLPKNLVAPVYKLRRFQQVSGTNTLTLGANVTLSQFNIPGTSIWNYSRSFITADLNLAAAGANLYNTIFTDSIPIDSIQLITNSGEVLAYIQNAQVLSKTARFMATDLKSYLSRGPVMDATYTATSTAAGPVTAAANSTVPNSINHGCQPCDRETWDFDYTDSPGTIAGINNVVYIQPQITPSRPTGLHILDVDGTAANAQLPNAAAAQTKVVQDSAIGPLMIYGADANSNFLLDTYTQAAPPVLGTDYVIALGKLLPKPWAYNDMGKRSAQRIISGQSNTATVIRCKFDLNAFVGTLFSCDKDFYFGQNLQLNIYWKTLSQLGFVSQLNSITGLAAITGATSLSNYYLFLSEDIDKANIASMKSHVESEGIEMLIPYTLCSQLTTATGVGTQSIFSTLLTPGSGLALKRIITVPVAGGNVQAVTSDTSNLAYLTNPNVVGTAPVLTSNTKWTQLQTFLDGNPLQDQPLVDNNGDVWNFMYPMIKNSPCGMSYREFHLNEFFVDNFSDCDDGPSMLENDCKESGLKIDFGKTYMFQITSNYALILFQYQVWVRKLIIKPSGIQWGV